MDGGEAVKRALANAADAADAVRAMANSREPAAPVRTLIIQLFLDRMSPHVDGGTLDGRVKATFRRKPKPFESNVTCADWEDQDGYHRDRYVEETLYETHEPVWVIGVHQWFGYPCYDESGREEAEWHYVTPGMFIDGADPRPEHARLNVWTDYDLLTLDGQMRIFTEVKHGYIRTMAARWLQEHATPPKEIAFEQDHVRQSGGKSSGARNVREARKTRQRKTWLECFDDPNRMEFRSGPQPDEYFRLTHYERRNEELFRDLVIKARSFGVELDVSTDRPARRPRPGAHEATAPRGQTTPSAVPLPADGSGERVSILRLPIGGPLAVRRCVDIGFLRTVPASRGGESEVDVSLIRTSAAPDSPERVAVSLDGQVVGLLSVHVSSTYVPVLRLAEERGLTLEARAVVRRGVTGAEIEVWAPRAPALDADWLAALRASAAVCPVTPAADPLQSTEVEPGRTAGWYADPLGAETVRYWDGSAWTDGERS